MNWINQSLCLVVGAGVFATTDLPANAKPKNADTLFAPEVVPARFIEYQADEIGLVLRTLARQGKLNVVVGDEVQGTVTARLENKTPRQAIDAIAKVKDLLVEEKDGTLYIRGKSAPLPKVPDLFQAGKSLDETISTIVTPALTRLYDAVLEHQASPETARKIAKAKKALYDAFIAEGFTKDEAFRLLLSSSHSSLLEPGR